VSGRSSHTLRLAGIAVSVLCLAAVVWWAAKQPEPQLPSTPGQWTWLLAAVGIYLVNACVLRGERWLLLLRRNGGEQSHRVDCYALSAVGFMGNNVLPARAGDAMRVVGMAPRAHVSYRGVIGTLIAERVLDVLVLLAVFVAVAFGLLHGVALPSGRRFELVVGIAAVLAALAAIAGIWLARRGTLRHWLDFLKPMVQATANLRGRHGAEALGLTMAIWGTEIVVWWATGHACGVDFSLLQACYLISLASIFIMVPAGPGYIGTLDAAVIFGVKAIGGTGQDALSYLLLLRFVLLIPITLVGLSALLARYGGVRFMRTEVQGA
jgi:glycosyltransferase 2 family protein